MTVVSGRSSTAAFALMVIISGVLVEANNVDLFNYKFSNEGVPGGGTDYGQQYWNRVTCDSLSSCVRLVLLDCAVPLCLLNCTLVRPF